MTNIEFNLQDVFSNSHPEQNVPIASDTWESWFQTWLEAISHLPEADSYELSLRLTDDREIQSLNAQYRNKNQPTDVLAFAALEVDVPSRLEQWPSSEPLYLGDIIISVETASRQAQQQEHALTTELAWLAAHGFLHLLGWDHPDEESLSKMLAQQESLLKWVSLSL